MSFRIFSGLPFALPPRAAAQRRGFTLVEILTATAIMALIVSLVMTVMTQVLAGWNRASEDLDTSEKASKIFHLVSQDLETAIFRSDGNQWMSLTSESPAGSPTTDATMSRLIFYTTPELRQTKDSGQGGTAGQVIPGDICAVEYRVVYADPFGNSSSTQKTFQLHRVVVDAASTFLGVNKQPLMGISQAGNSKNQTLWQAFDAIVDKTDQPISSQIALGSGKNLNINIYGAKNKNSIMEDNVVQFNVFLYFYGYNSSGGAGPAIQPYPMTQYGLLNPPVYYYGGGPQTATPSNPSFLDAYTASKTPPIFISMAYADITVTLLTDDGAAQLQSYGTSMPQGFVWQQFVQQYGKTYTQRVRFYNKPH
ncbi:MAG TPA: prepilin-type N-terminal cleavage/methylation domain-containing protein [Opitutales bacterium]|jgi:prepilin-type N-terminal cleavage/methylation domain-containing protein|nr:prepilin-type N-terminal cleavage/methylation domain-containing protein [Opitutales bacterium]